MDSLEEMTKFMTDRIDEAQKKGVRKINSVDMEKLSFRRNAKPKKTPSLFDTPLENRTFWGNDAGSELIKALVRPEIRRSLSLGHMYDFLLDERVGKLVKSEIDELRQEEFNFMTVLYSEEGISEFMMPGCDGYVVVSFDDETKKYVFTVTN